MARSTRGSELMQKLNDGRLVVVPPAEILKLRNAISTEIEELLEVGARIRPLLCGKERIGWVRGVHMAERKNLKRYFSDPMELVALMLGSSRRTALCRRRSFRMSNSVAQHGRQHQAFPLTPDWSPSSAHVAQAKRRSPT
jgi:hypothetical protein